MDFLLCDIGGLRCALPTSDVREVLRAVTILPLPGAPPAVDGVINVRGALVPVLNLRHRLGLAAIPLEVSEHFVIARAGDREVAVRVDRALDVVSMPEGDVETGAQGLSVAEFVAGIGRQPDGLILIQDVSHFLRPADEQVLDDSIHASRRESAQ